MPYRFADSTGNNEKILGSTPNFPIPHFPTLPPEDGLVKRYNTKHHMRHGTVQGTLHYGDKLRWVLEWQFINSAECLALQGVADWRVFQFDDGNGSLIPVRHVEDKFEPVNQRGGFCSLRMTLEEL